MGKGGEKGEVGGIAPWFWGGIDALAVICCRQQTVHTIRYDAIQYTDCN